MKVIIIEDEKLSAEHLHTLIKKVDASIDIIATFDTVKKTIDAFDKGITADLLFVDIHLADGISFEIFSKISTDIPVIFTTAYNEYALRAFKLNSVDYLLKPIGIQDLQEALEKFKRINLNTKHVLLENIQNTYAQLNKQYKSRFMVKMGDSIASVETEGILYFVSEDGAVLITLDSGKRYIVDYTLDQLEALVSPKQFFRINRKVIINYSSIQKINSYFNSRLKIQVHHLTDDDCIVSRERVNEFKTWLDK